MKKICFSISFFSHISLFILLSITFRSDLITRLPITDNHSAPQMSRFKQLHGVKNLSVMERPSEFTGLSVIRFSILCFFSRIKRLANWFAMDSKRTIGREPVKRFLVPFINLFLDARKRFLVIWPTASNFREPQHEFHIIAHLQVIYVSSHLTGPFYLHSQAIKWSHPGNYLSLLTASTPKEFS